MLFRQPGGTEKRLNAGVRICLMLEGQEGITWEQWLELATVAEQSGLDGLFRSDHYRSIVRGDPAGSLDAWATLAALAACTERIRLGTMVSPVTFRPAAVLAKSAVTVDHISGGRVELGIGAGWYEAEHDTYRLPFLTVRERVDELDRQLAEIERQWTAGDVWPKPVQARLPIIVGGRARPRTVHAAVRFATEYNTVFPTVEEARDRRRLLDQAARSAGREPLRFSIMTGCVIGRDEGEVRDRLKAQRELVGEAQPPPPLAGTVEQVAETLRRYETVGVERAMLQHLVHEDVEMVALLGELATALA
jgi:alkanesulfonate monooxygenase SsuD/methylene tetrahydromethanopterin reductase-like flavin-dependent oxidoreductase (luciferase family)